MRNEASYLRLETDVFILEHWWCFLFSRLQQLHSLSEAAFVPRYNLQFHTDSIKQGKLVATIHY